MYKVKAKKMAIISILFLSWYFVLSVELKAQNKIVENLNANDVEIEGMVDDSLINSLPNGQTDMVIVISKYPFNQIKMQRAENRTYKFKVRNNETFKIAIPAPSDRFYVFFHYDSPYKSGDRYWSSYENIYILEKGDRIKCKFSKHIFKFDGKGAEKLNCQSEIYKSAFAPDDNYYVQLIRAKSYRKYIDGMNQGLDSALRVKLDVVKKYRPILGNDLADIFIANCYGERYFSSYRYYNMASSEKPDYFKEILKTKKFDSVQLQRVSTLNPSLIVQAPLYTDALFEMIRLYTKSNIGKRESDSLPKNMDRAFNFILTNFSGIVREKLLATFFIQWATQPTVFDYYYAARNILKSSKYNKILVDIEQKNAKEKPFYPFKLEDVSGKIVKLEHLKDKLVIVDFWYTGCQGCVNLKRAMEGVWNTFKNNPNVAFVSICIDKDKKQWKESIKSKLYTEPEAINLYTGGKGKDHPIISSLEISYYPRMYLLKKGKLLTANLPWPSGPNVMKGTTKDYIFLIQKALKN